MFLSGESWVGVSRTQMGQQLCHSSFPFIPLLFHFTSFTSTADTPQAYGFVLLTVPGGEVLPADEDLKVPAENRLLSSINPTTSPLCATHVI